MTAFHEHFRAELMPSFGGGYGNRPRVEQTQAERDLIAAYIAENGVNRIPMGVTGEEDMNAHVGESSAEFRQRMNRSRLKKKMWVNGK